MKEPEIKLFGRKINLSPESAAVADCDECSGELSGGGNGDGKSVTRQSSDDNKELRVEEGEEVEEAIGEADEANQQIEEDQLMGDLNGSRTQDKEQNPEADESQTPKALSQSDDNPCAADEDAGSTDPPKSENDQGEATNSQQKILKKPDKILPCPRCNSMDTKFCYYNNYNVNQPRHFCKSCQRYWTAGGTMRNVPVGAGRRKNKNSASHCRHITISEALQAARIDIPNGYHHSTFKPNGTVLSFGPDSPLCESMASVLNLADKKVPNGFRNGFYKMENQGPSVYCKGGDNGDDCSSGSSVTTSNSMAEDGKNGPQEGAIQNVNGFPTPVPCIPGVPWHFPWNSAVPVPAICPPGFAMPFYPAPYWNCPVPNGWNVPWLSIPSPPSSGSSPKSPLGKHSRDGELLKPNNPEVKESSPEQKSSERSIVIPKTLRIDDPDEAAKSSIWSTLGIKYDSKRREGLFKALQPKGNEKKHMPATSPVLQANPAALSRSFSFQEGA